VTQLNPIPPQPQWMRARMLLYSGRVDEAEKVMRDLVARNPGQFKAQAYFGMMLYYAGKLDEADAVFTRARQLAGNTDDDSVRMLSAFLYASRGQREKIELRILHYRPADVIDADAAYWLSGIYALLGDHEHMRAFFQRTADLGFVNYPWFTHDKNFDSVRSDSQYQTILNNIHDRWQAIRTEFNSGQ